jgi:hypothetical protein
MVKISGKRGLALGWHAGQHIFVVRREDYVYLVPFVEDEHTVFLKTIIPSRKATKQFLGEDPMISCPPLSERSER